MYTHRFGCIAVVAEHLSCNVLVFTVLGVWGMDVQANH